MNAIVCHHFQPSAHSAVLPAIPLAGLAEQVCELLQVAASALHLIDRELDDDLRPLVRVGLAAIREAAATAHA